MHLIYQNAELTIVAGSGDNAEAGLPGVSSIPRTQQWQAKVGRHLLVSLKSEPELVIMASPWASRGWTFQEAMFSHRLLIFTEQQVYFECQSANFCETFAKDHVTSTCNFLAVKSRRQDTPGLFLAT